MKREDAEVFSGGVGSYLCLTDMHLQGILMHMRTTLNVDDSLLRRASRLTGVKEKTSLVRLGLEALIARESARRLADLGGTEKGIRAIRRRRSAKAA
jgi:Arc/MetJ family transcription regulator